MINTVGCILKKKNHIHWSQTYRARAKRRIISRRSEGLLSSSKAFPFSPSIFPWTVDKALPTGKAVIEGINRKESGDRRCGRLLVLLRAARAAPAAFALRPRQGSLAVRLGSPTAVYLPSPSSSPGSFERWLPLCSSKFHVSLSCLSLSLIIPTTSCPLGRSGIEWVFRVYFSSFSWAWSSLIWCLGDFTCFIFSYPLLC